MTRLSILPISIGLALFAFSPVAAGRAYATETGAAMQGRTPGETTALDALTQAHGAAQQRQNRKALEEIERAEVALLNLTQVERDAHFELALQRLAAAREKVEQGDFAAADRQLADAAHTLSVAAGGPPAADTQAAQDSDRARLVGSTVYDTQDQPLGPVVQLVVDPAGDLTLVVIDVGDFVDDQGKTVGVVPGELSTQHGHLTLDRSRAQLQQASDYRDADRGARAGSSAPPAARHR